METRRSDILKFMKTSTLTPTQSEVWTAYQRMRVRLAGRLNREISRQTGLSEADFEILTALLSAPHESVRTLALRCGLEWEKSRLSHQLRRMEERGLVVREECVEDNRGTVIRVTETGRRQAEAAKETYEAAVRRYFMDVLTPEQIGLLAEITGSVLGMLDGDAPLHHGSQE